MGIPDKLVGFRGYEGGKNMIGIADVSLSDIAYMSEAIKGAGIAGEVDAPAIGQLQSMTTTINWRSITDDNVKLSAPKTHHLDFRGSIQIYDESSGEFDTKAVKAVVKVIPKKLALGKLDVATGMGTSGEYETIYIKLSIGDAEVLEIDKFNYICKIDGVDYLEKVRKDLGM